VRCLSRLAPVFETLAAVQREFSGSDLQRGRRPHSVYAVPPPTHPPSQTRSPFIGKRWALLKISELVVLRPQDEALCCTTLMSRCPTAASLQRELFEDVLPAIPLSPPNSTSCPLASRDETAEASWHSPYCSSFSPHSWLTLPFSLLLWPPLILQRLSASLVSFRKP
jgi:hypothetical protein